MDELRYLCRLRGGENLKCSIKRNEALTSLKIYTFNDMSLALGSVINTTNSKPTAASLQIITYPNFY